MKASEVTKPGPYWFRGKALTDLTHDLSNWTLVHVTARWGGYLEVGNDSGEWGYRLEELDGEFVGPIESPAADGEDREFSAFLAGFAASFEGYNGECQASDPIWSELPRALAEIRSNPRVMVELRRLFETSRVDPGSLRQP